MQALLVRKAAAVTRSSLQHTDERGKLEGELMGGIDVVKCYAWEVGRQAWWRAGGGLGWGWRGFCGVRGLGLLLDV